MSIQFKRSSAINQPPEPAHLAPGELAINLADKKLYTKNDKNKVINIGFSDETANATFLKLSGGNLTGPVVLYEGTLPTKLDEIVSKRYVDSRFGSGSDQVLTNGQLGSTYVSKSGDTMSGKLRLEYQVIPADDQYHAVNKAFTESLYLKISGGTITGNIRVSASQNNSLPDDALISKDYANRTYINSAGDTMTGALTLDYTPSAPKHAVPKSYVDTSVGNAYPKTGGVVSGTVDATGGIISRSSSGLRINYGNFGAMWHNNGSDFHMLFTTPGNTNGTFGDLRPLWANMTTGTVSFGHGIDIAGWVTARSGMWLAGNLDANDVQIRSDRKLKRNFEPLNQALDKLCTLSVSTYLKEGKDQREAGLIAQEVQEVLPEAVAETSSGTLSVYPMGIIALLVKAVQELREEVEELKKNQN